MILKVQSTPTRSSSQADSKAMLAPPIPPAEKMIPFARPRRVENHWEESRETGYYY